MGASMAISINRGRLSAPLILLALAGCATPQPPAEERSITLHFALDAACGQDIRGLAPVPVRLRDARLYLSDLALIDRAGRLVPLRLMENQWQHDGIALLDFEDASGGCAGTPDMNDRVTGQVPAGDYRGVTFTVGVPSPVNHSSTETASPPLDLAAMGWSWQAGRKFIKIELLPADGVTRPNGAKAAAWNLHLGSTNCTGEPIKGEAVNCANPNRIKVKLDHFDSGRDVVRLDLRALFAGSDVTRDTGGALGCMSGPADLECPPLFKAMGLRLHPSGEGRGDGGQMLPAGQRFIRGERRS